MSRFTPKVFAPGLDVINQSHSMTAPVFLSRIVPLDLRIRIPSLHPHLGERKGTGDLRTLLSRAVLGHSSRWRGLSGLLKPA